MVTLPVWFCVVDWPFFFFLVWITGKKNSSYTVSMGSIANCLSWRWPKAHFCNVARVQNVFPVNAS